MLHPFILSGVISPLISSSILCTYWPGEFIFQCPIFLPFHTLHRVLQARILKWFAIPSPVDHIWSELSTITHPSWVALHGMAHSFIKLDKAVFHVIRLVFCGCGFSLSALWCPFSTSTLLLGFLWPWTWGISSQPLAPPAPHSRRSPLRTILNENFNFEIAKKLHF